MPQIRVKPGLGVDELWGEQPEIPLCRLWVLLPHAKPQHVQRRAGPDMRQFRVCPPQGARAQIGRDRVSVSGLRPCERRPDARGDAVVQTAREDMAERFKRLERVCDPPPFSTLGYIRFI